MRWMVLLLLAVFLAAAEAPVFSDQEWAAGQQQTSRPATPEAAPGWGSVASLGIGLVVVVAVAAGLGWTAKRLNARRLLGGRGRNLELVETIQIGPQRTLALVRLGGQWLVVGMGEKELTHIATMTAPPESPLPTAPSAPSSAPAPATPSAFAGELARLTSGGARP